VSKYRFRESDIYLPGTEVPANRLGITDPELLHEVEQELLVQAYRIFIAELQSVPGLTKRTSRPSTGAAWPICMTRRGSIAWRK